MSNWSYIADTRWCLRCFDRKLPNRCKQHVLVSIQSPVFLVDPDAGFQMASADAVLRLSLLARHLRYGRIKNEFR